MADLSRQYSSACFLLQLGGAAAGFLRSLEGGEPFARVIDEPVDGNGVVKKHIGQPSYQPIVITFGAGMAATLYQWMSDTLDRKPAVKTGAVIVGDHSYKERYRIEFDNASLIGISFPAVDAHSKDAGVFTLTLQPEVARVNAAFLGTAIQGFTTKSQKKWLVSNFRLKISGLETACTKVNAVDALIATQTVTSTSVGVEREAVPAKPVLNIPDLRFTVAESTAQDILNWADDFVVKGNNGSASERSGTLEYLDTSLKKVLFTVSFSNLGVLRANRSRAEENAGVIARIAVQLYCEQMAFAPEKDTVGAAVASTSTSTSTPASSGNGGASISLADTLISIIAGKLTPESALQSALNVPGATQTSASAATSLSETVARRLLTTARPVETGPVVPKWDDGVALGEQWATTTASIDELSDIKTINQDDWSALKLETGHSLVEQLRSQGMIPDGVDGPLQLERDAFVEGIVAGAIQVFGSATPHLTRLSQTT